MTKKLEDQENRHRQELQLLIEKYDNDRLNMIQREATISGHRESERLKELKELYESKSKDKDEELSRLRERLNKSEQDCAKVREEMQVRNEKTLV